MAFVRRLRRHWPLGLCLLALLAAFWPSRGLRPPLRPSAAGEPWPPGAHPAVGPPGALRLQLMLQRGYWYHVAGAYGEAAQWYREVLRDATDPELLAVAQGLLTQLPHAQLPEGVRHLQRAPSLAASTPLPTERPFFQWPLWGMLGAYPVTLLDRLAQRVDQYLELRGRSELDYEFSEAQIRDAILHASAQLFPTEISEIDLALLDHGLRLTATFHASPVAVRLAIRGQLRAVRGRPQMAIQELHVGTLPVPRLLIDLLVNRLNQRLARQEWPVFIRRIEVLNRRLILSAEREAGPLTPYRGHPPIS